MATKVTKTVTTITTTTTTTTIAPKSTSKLTAPEGKFKLYYFPLNGRGFPARVALTTAGFDFEDNRLTFEEFGKLRAGKDGEKYNEEVPLGTFPILVFPDGEQIISQSSAISKFAGKYCGLYPQDPLKAIIVDEVMDSINDFIMLMPNDSDKEKEKEAYEIFAKEKLPKYFNLFSKRIKKSGGPFVLGECLSVADLLLFSLVNLFVIGFTNPLSLDTLQPWKNVLEHYDAVKSHPTVVKSNAIKE